jgi:protein gp37
LKQINCKRKWINIEPILSDIPKLDLSGIKWVCGGSES